MGQVISVTAKQGAHHGVVRFEMNRALTGMAHERYSDGQTVIGNRPPDELARRILALGIAESVHIHGNQITLALKSGASADGVIDTVTDLFIHYKPGVQPSFQG